MSEKSGDGMSAGKIAVGVCTLLGGVASVIAILQFLGVNPSETPQTAKISETTEMPRVTTLPAEEPAAVSESAIPEENDTAEPTTEDIAAATADVQTENAAATEAASSIVPAASSAYTLTVIDKVPLEGFNGRRPYYWYTGQGMQYDAAEKVLYYLRDNQTIVAYHTDTGASEIVVDLSVIDQGSCFDGLVFNPFAGKLYASGKIYISRNQAINGLYDVAADQFAVPTDEIEALRYARFTSVDEVCCLNADNAPMIFSLKDTARDLHGNQEPVSKQPFYQRDVLYSIGIKTNNSVAGVFPFVESGLCYYLVIADDNNPLYTIKTGSFLPTVPPTEYLRSFSKDSVVSFSSADEGLYYMTSDKSIYRYDVNAVSSGGLVSEKNMQDILVFDGADMPNSLTASVSGDIDSLLWVNENLFFLYDRQDESLKMISAGD